LCCAQTSQSTPGKRKRASNVSAQIARPTFPIIVYRPAMQGGTSHPAVCALPLHQRARARSSPGCARVGWLTSSIRHVSASLADGAHAAMGIARVRELPKAGMRVRVERDVQPRRRLLGRLSAEAVAALDAVNQRAQVDVAQVV